MGLLLMELGKHKQPMLSQNILMAQMTVIQVLYVGMILQ